VDLCRIEWRRRSPFIVFWLTLIAVVFLPSLFDPFRGIVYPHVFAASIVITENLLIKYSVFVFVVMLFFRLMYVVYDQLFFRRVCSPLSMHLEEKDGLAVYFYVGMIFASLFAFYEVYRTFGIGFVSGFGFEERRNGLSLVSGFLLSYSYMVSAGLGLWFFVKRQYSRFILILAFFTAAYLLFGGSRQPLVAFFIPLLLYPAMGRKKRSALILVIMLGSAVLFSDILNALLYLRNLPSFSERLELIMDLPRLMTEATSREGGEGMVRYAFYYYLESARYIDGYFHFEYLSRFLLFWLPSGLDFFHIKPDDFEYFMFAQYMTGHVGTMHPTVFGSIYADSGWFFIPWAFLLSLLLYFLPLYIQRFTGLIYVCLWSTICFYSLMLARGSLYGSAVVIFFSILFALLINFIAKVRMSK
tara:strand:- start:120 stop:1364 length:1245 start_codon:yes stop_codon:yes gene_type:complete